MSRSRWKEEGTTQCLTGSSHQTLPPPIALMQESITNIFIDANNTIQIDILILFSNNQNGEIDPLWEPFLALAKGIFLGQDKSGQREGRSQNRQGEAEP